MRNIFNIIIISTGLLFSQTAEQIKQAKEIIQRTGMSESQARDVAKAQGYTDKQIDAAIQKEKALQTGPKQSVPEVAEKVGLPELGKSNEVVQEQPVLETMEPIVGEELPVMDKDDLEIVDESGLDIASEAQPARRGLTYFGYDIFKRDPALFQATSVGAVDPDYLIGPGDEIIVMLWGETQFRQVLTVDREGFVFIPEIGQVFVNGLNLNLLESKLFRVFSQSYASLNPQGRTPTTFLDVSLGNLRPLRIQVLGEVAQPGAYTVSPSATLFSSLYYFNGPSTLGSLRDIQLIRGGKKIASIDFYNYLLTGKKPKDQKLQLDDVIFIPKRGKTVSIQGEVNRNAIYEMKENEGFNDILAMAGRLKNTAYLDRAQIDRIVPFDERTDYWNDRVLEDFHLGMILKDDRALKLRDGDQIQIFSIMDMHRNDIYIFGPAVTRPGRFELTRGMRIADLVQEANGLLSDAFLEKAHINRTSQDDLKDELISFHLGKALDGDPEHNLPLEWMDRVRIFSYSEMIPEYSISLRGHVKFPGNYKLLENMTLYDLLFQYGGFLDEEFKKRTYLKRAELVRVNENNDEKEIIPFNLGQVLDKQGIANTTLRTDDAVRVYSVTEIEGATRYVSISGHVKRPGRYELFEENMRIHDLLFKAGGFDDPLYKSQTFLKRADLIRFDNDRISQTIIPFNLDNVLSDKSDKQNIILLPGDVIRVYSETVFNTVRSVSINGVVRSPGNYNLKTGMTLKDLILEAGGLNENVYRYRVEVARIDPLNNNLDKYAEVITFNMDEKFSVSFRNSPDSSEKVFSAASNGFQLNPYDLVSIRPDPYFSNQKQITISGEVLYPGQYTILTSDEKITDIIERAGGLLPSAYPDASQYNRQGVKINASLGDILKNPKSKLNFEVQDNDEILIVPHPNVVSITGEVNTSGIHKYVPGKRLRFYIKLAGGLNPDADKNNIWIEFPNGDSKKYNKWSLMSPKVIDGSFIMIGRKQEEEPFDRTEFAKEITTILANLAQAVAVVALAAK